MCLVGNKKRDSKIIDVSKNNTIIAVFSCRFGTLRTAKKVTMAGESGLPISSLFFFVFFEPHFVFFFFLSCFGGFWEHSIHLWGRKQRGSPFPGAQEPPLMIGRVH